MWHATLKMMEIKGKREWDIFAPSSFSRMMKFEWRWVISLLKCGEFTLPFPLDFHYKLQPWYFFLQPSQMLQSSGSLECSWKDNGILHDSTSWLVPWDYQGSSACALYRCLFHSAQYAQYQNKASLHIYSCIGISAHIWSTYSWYMYIFIFPYFWLLIFYFSSTFPIDLT